MNVEIRRYDHSLFLGRNMLIKTDTGRDMFVCKEMSQHYITESKPQHVNRKENGAGSHCSETSYRAIVKRAAATKLSYSSSFFMFLRVKILSLLYAWRCGNCPNI